MSQKCFYRNYLKCKSDKWKIYNTYALRLEIVTKVLLEIKTRERFLIWEKNLIEKFLFCSLQVRFTREKQCFCNWLELPESINFIAPVREQKAEL